jgi:MFS family permease
MAGRNKAVQTLVGQGVSQDLAVLAVTMSVAAFGAGLIIPLLAPLLAGLPDPRFPATVLGLPVTTELQVGVLFSLFGVVRSILQVPMGRLSDYVGVRKPFLEAGMLASAVTLYAYGTVDSVGALVTVRVLQGVALAVSTPALFAIVEGVTERTTRGGSMGFFSTLRTLGWGLGPVVGGVIVDLYGMSAAFTLGAALTVLAVGAIRLTVPDVPPTETEGSAGSTAATDAAVRGDVLWLFSTRRQASTLLGLALALVTLMMGFSAMVAMENPILERIGGTKAGFGLVFAITTLTRLVVQFPVGIASDRYGRKQFIVWGLLSSAPLVGLMGFAHTLVEFVALRGVLGIALAGVIAPTYALAADVVDEHRSGEQMAVVTTAFSVGFAVGPLLAGGVAFLGFAVPFVLAAVLTVVGGVAVRLMVEDPT